MNRVQGFLDVRGEEERGVEDDFSDFNYKDR